MIVTRQNIDYIVETALYGGIDYWAAEVTFEPQTLSLTEGATVTITEDTGDKHLLTTEDMYRAVKEYCDESYCEPDGTLDAGRIDAADADAIIQLVIFKEQKYG